MAYGRVGYRWDGPLFASRARVLAWGGSWCAVLCATIVLASLGPATWRVHTSLARTSSTTNSTSHVDMLIGVSQARQVIIYTEQTQYPLKDDPSRPELSYTESHVISLYGADGGLGGGWKGCTYGCASCPEYEYPPGSGDRYCHTIIDAETKVVEVQCDGGSNEHCDTVPLAIVDFIDHKDYFINDTVTVLDLPFPARAIAVDYTTATINPDYTHWEVPWKYALQLFTLLFLFAPRIGLVPALRRARQPWTRQQRWCVALLALLWTFDDPLIAIQVYVYGAGRPLLTLHAIAQATFLSALLLHWLELYSLAAKSSLGDATTTSISARSCCRHALAYWARYVIVTMIFVSATVAYVHVRVEQESTATYAPGQGGATAAEAAVGVSLGLWVLWLAVELARGFRTFPAATPSYKLLLAVALLTLSLMVAGLFAGVTMPLRMNATVWLTWTALPNLYVWLLSAGYAPDERTDASRTQAGADADEDKFALAWPAATDGATV